MRSRYHPPDGSPILPRSDWLIAAAERMDERLQARTSESVNWPQSSTAFHPQASEQTTLGEDLSNESEQEPSKDSSEQSQELGPMKEQTSSPSETTSGQTRKESEKGDYLGDDEEWYDPTLVRQETRHH